MQRHWCQWSPLFELLVYSWTLAFSTLGVSHWLQSAPSDGVALMHLVLRADLSASGSAGIDMLESVLNMCGETCPSRATTVYCWTLVVLVGLQPWGCICQILLLQIWLQFVAHGS